RSEGGITTRVTKHPLRIRPPRARKGGLCGADAAHGDVVNTPCWPSRVPNAMTVFTPQQDSALSAVGTWLKAKPGRRAPQIFRLFGYAGTGKTTLAKHIAQHADGKVLFAAFTGKAASVMRSKGCAGATTIHATIYQAHDSGEETPSFDLWHEGPAAKAKLI